MEDTVHLARGKSTPSNAALVEKSARIIEDLGGKIATVAEARQLLGLAPRPTQTAPVQARARVEASEIVVDRFGG
jgi:hypothetical protein